MRKPRYFGVFALRAENRTADVPRNAHTFSAAGAVSRLDRGAEVSLDPVSGKGRDGRTGKGLRTARHHRQGFKALSAQAVPQNPWPGSPPVGNVS